MLLRPQFKETPNVKIMFNIGALLDIPTGYYVRGKYGESILNGGLGIMTAVTGIGNSFKSTLMHYMMLSAASKVAEVTATNMSTYDTELNIHEARLKAFSDTFDVFRGKDIIDEGMWSITDKTVYQGNEWYEIFKAYLKDKRANFKDLLLETPFLERDKVTLMKTITPTFGEMDSLTYFATADVDKIQDENELGESGGNMIHARQGLAKSRLFMELPALVGGSNHFMLFSAHLGKDMALQSGPYAAPPVKKLHGLKNGDKIKGVTDNFFFLMSNCWQSYNATPLLNKDTKGPEYPLNPNDPQPGNLDLNTVTIKQLRSKSGPTGAVFDILVSQSSGVLPSLTEFHYLRTNERYGLTGTANFSLDIYPAVKLTRPSLRSKIDSDPLLRRALNITAELCQISLMWRHLDSRLICTPKQLYDDLIALGYDWDVLLKTRGYWVFNNDKHPVPFLSTMDLLRCRIGEYRPYWLK